MIRIAHLITDLSVGGAEMMLYRLVDRMDSRRFSSLVISLTDIGSVGKNIQKLGIPVESLGMRLGRPSPAALPRLVRVLRSYRPHLLQTWLYHSDLLGLLASGLSRSPRLVWNLRCSDMDLSKYGQMTRWVVRVCSTLSRRPDAVIANSESGRRYHAAIGYRPRRWEPIPNGFDLELFRPDPASRGHLRTELGLPHDALLVGLVARLDPMKDHRTFLEAAAEVHNRHSKVHFVLCGARALWDNEALASSIASLGLRPVMHLLGERHDISALTAALDIACSSSITEGFPTAVGEAMACGVPCAVTDAGDSSLLLGDGGRVVAVRDSRALAGAITNLIDVGPELRREIGARGRRRVHDNYSLTAIVSRYENLYKELAGKCAE